MEYRKPNHFQQGDIIVHKQSPDNIFLTWKVIRVTDWRQTIEVECILDKRKNEIPPNNYRLATPEEIATVIARKILPGDFIVY